MYNECTMHHAASLPAFIIFQTDVALHNHFLSDLAELSNVAFQLVAPDTNKQHFLFIISNLKLTHVRQSILLVINRDCIYRNLRCSSHDWTLNTVKRENI